MGAIDGVGIILPAHQEGDWVRSTVASFHEDIPEAQIVVIDDASTDGCCDGLPDFVDILRNEVRKGVAGSRNRGLDFAAGDNFIVADAHCEVVQPGALRNLMRCAIDNDAFAVVQANSMDPARRRPKWGGEFLFMRDQYIGWRYGKRREADMEYTTRVPNGGCYALTRKLRDKLGLWPTTAGLWGHNPVTKGLLCWMTETPVILTRHAQVAHAYKDPSYSFGLDSQWRNACRTYSIAFNEGTYFEYWAPILSTVLGREYVDAMWQETKPEREAFQMVKIKTDAEFFGECLQAPVKTYGKGVISVPRVSVIIPCHNEGVEIKATVESIRASNTFDHDIIVVDDASTDGCCDKLKREVDSPDPVNLWQWVNDQHELAARKKAVAGYKKGCMVLRNVERSGVSGARNAGCDAVKDFADIILTSDAAVRWEPDTARQLAQTVIDTDGLVASSFANWSEKPEDATKRVYGANLRLRTRRGLGAEYRRTEPEEDVSPVPHVIGSVYGMWRTDLERLGGWVHVDGGHWGCAEAFLTLGCYFNGIPMHVDKRCFVRHKTTDGGSVEASGYVKRVHLLHNAPFTLELYKRIFKPVIDELGPVNMDDAYNTAYVRCIASFWEHRVRSESDFIADYFPEFADDYMTWATDVADRREPWEPPAPESKPPKIKPTHVPISKNAWLEATCCNHGGATLLIDCEGMCHILLEAQEGTTARVISRSGVTFCPFCGKPIQDMTLRPPVITSAIQTQIQLLDEQRNATRH